MAHVRWMGEGLTLLIERSKTDADGKGAEITIPRGRSEEAAPVTALQAWLTAAEITAGPLFRKVNRGGHVETATAEPRTLYSQILGFQAQTRGIFGSV